MLFCIQPFVIRFPEFKKGNRNVYWYQSYFPLNAELDTWAEISSEIYQIKKLHNSLVTLSMLCETKLTF